MSVIIDAACNATVFLTLIFAPIIGLAIKEHHHEDQIQ